MLERIAAWLLKQILQYLLDKAVDAFVEKSEELRKEQARGEINAANSKAYEEAADRVSRISDAMALLNRNP